jgi:hypothetical protein
VEQNGEAKDRDFTTEGAEGTEFRRREKQRETVVAGDSVISVSLVVRAAPDVLRFAQDDNFARQTSADDSYERGEIRKKRGHGGAVPLR